MIKTTIFDATGLCVSLELRKELTVEQAKTQALCELAPNNTTLKHTQHYKLVSSKSGRSLHDNKKLEDEVIYANDELLLLRRCPPEDTACSSSSPGGRSPVVKQIPSGDDERYRAPNFGEIQCATEHICSMDMDRPNGEPPPKGEFRNEIRKIMVTLVECAEILLKNHTDVKPVFLNLEEKMNNHHHALNEPSVDPGLIKKMTDMGFDSSLARRALIAKKSCPAAALELLLSGQHEELFEHTPAKQSKIPKAYAMLLCFQEYRRRMYKANKKAVENLKDMGFSEPDILDALRIHSNSQEAACNWLLSDRKATPEDFEVGLDPGGVIYRAISSNPVIQLGLSTPKVLMALLQILENPHCVNRWMNDSDTAALLSHLFRIYHSEKTSLHVQ